jgi:hypothetical protein
MVFGSAGWDCYSGDCNVIAMKSGGKPPSQLANVANVRNVTTFAGPEGGLAPALPIQPLINSALHQLNKPLKQVLGIMRTGCGLRMVLHREHR